MAKTTLADVQHVLTKYIADREDVPDGALLVNFVVGGEYMFRPDDNPKYDHYSRFYGVSDHCTPSATFGLVSLIQSDVAEDLVGSDPE